MAAGPEAAAGRPVAVVAVGLLELEEEEEPGPSQGPWAAWRWTPRRVPARPGWARAQR